jgi:hypothetical protein
MGQYHVVANIDKQEYIHPHALDIGLKQVEQLHSTPSTPHALFMLLCASNHRGGGDIRLPEGPVLGRWVGDRIVVVGDYSGAADFPESLDDVDGDRLWDTVMSSYKDISSEIREAFQSEFSASYEVSPQTGRIRLAAVNY